MDPTENLLALHKVEEEIRATSLAAIELHHELREHWAIVAEAMAVVVAFSRDHKHQSVKGRKHKGLARRFADAELEALLLLRLAVLAQHSGRGRRQRDRASTAFRLGRLEYQPGLGLLEALDDTQHGGIEIDVLREDVRVRVRARPGGHRQQARDVSLQVGAVADVDQGQEPPVAGSDAREGRDVLIAQASTLGSKADMPSEGKKVKA